MQLQWRLINQDMEGKKINLGCGKFKLEGFVNIDIDKSVNPNLVCDIRKLPFEDDSIEEIYAGHIIEHFTIEDARKVLSECLRVLEPQGKIGIVVPEKDLTPKSMIDGENGKYMKHLSYWNLEMLKEEVKKIGFEQIETMNINTYPHLVDRPKWQVGVIAYKGGKKMKKKFEGQDVKEKVIIPKFNEKEYSWCKHEKKVIYNPNKKRHCPQCKKLL